MFGYIVSVVKSWWQACATTTIARSPKYVQERERERNGKGICRHGNVFAVQCKNMNFLTNFRAVPAWIIHYTHFMHVQSSFKHITSNLWARALSSAKLSVLKFIDVIQFEMAGDSLWINHDGRSRYIEYTSQLTEKIQNYHNEMKKKKSTEKPQN